MPCQDSVNGIKKVEVIRPGSFVNTLERSLHKRDHESQPDFFSFLVLFLVSVFEIEVSIEHTT